MLCPEVFRDCRNPHVRWYSQYFANPETSLMAAVNLLSPNLFATFYIKKNIKNPRKTGETTLWINPKESSMNPKDPLHKPWKKTQQNPVIMYIDYIVEKLWGATPCFLLRASLSLPPSMRRRLSTYFHMPGFHPFVVGKDFRLGAWSAVSRFYRHNPKQVWW